MKSYTVFLDDTCREFLLQVKHNIGLIDRNYKGEHFIFQIKVNIPEYIFPDLLEEIVNVYMIRIHEWYNNTKTWKSYDW